jgi:hypothetical protein
MKVGLGVTSIRSITLGDGEIRENARQAAVLRGHWPDAGRQLCSTDLAVLRGSWL